MAVIIKQIKQINLLNFKLSSKFFIRRKHILTSKRINSGSRPHDVVRIRRALDETGYGRSPDNPSTRYDRSYTTTSSDFRTNSASRKTAI